MKGCYVSARAGRISNHYTFGQIEETRVMKTIAIISAMKIELVHVGKILSERPDWKKTDKNIYENKEKQLRIVTRILGIGKVNAAYQTADIIWEYLPDLIINVGYAGGLAVDAKRGDLAIGTDYVQVDMKTYLEENRPVIEGSPRELVSVLQETAARLAIPSFAGKIATGDFFLHRTKDKERIIEEYHPIAFDMESAAIAQVATQKKVPFISIRTFSDMADDYAVHDLFHSKKSKIPIEQRPIILAIEALEISAETNII